MSSIQIPNLPAVISLAGAELLETVQAGVSSRVNVAQIAQYVNAVYPTDVAMPAGTVRANLMSSPELPADEPVSTVLDYIGNTPGSLLYRDTSVWDELPPSTAGYVLTTQGAGFGPTWAPGSGIVPGPQATVSTKADFEATFFLATVLVVNRLAYSADIQDGATVWSRVTSEPTHPGKMRSVDRFLPDGTTSPANGGWWELKAGTCNPANFGGEWYPYDEATWSASGKTASDAALADAVDYMAATGAVIDHPGVIYVATATLVLTPLVSNNFGTLYIDFSTAVLSDIEGALTAVSLQGEAPTLIGTLTADLRLPSNPFIVTVYNTLTLSSVAGLEVNDIIMLSSLQNIASGNVTSYSAQPLRVMEIDAGASTITTYDEPWNSYLVSDSASVYKFDTRTRINITGELRLYGGGFRAQGDNSGQMGLFCTYCYNNRYARLTTFDMQHGTYSEWDSIGTFGRLIDYHGCNAPAIDPVTGGANTAYPVGCAGSYDAYFGDVIANRARHGYTNSVSPNTDWCGNNQRVGKMRLKEMFGGGFDGHPGAGMTYCESLEIEYNPGNADTGSSQVCLSQGAGYQIGTIRVNGRVPSRAVSFESYGWRTMTFLDPADLTQAPQFLHEPSAWVGSFVADGGVSGNVARATNYTNQSGLVSPQRIHLQIDNIDARGSAGASAQGLQGGVNVVLNGGRIVANSDIIHASTYSTSTLRTVTGAVDNGAGLIRLTASTTDMVTGGVATVASVGGVPNATGTWLVTVINATTFDLVGSTFAGAYTTGGTALTANNMRAVTGAGDNGAGLIRLTVASTLGIYTGSTVRVQSVGGVPNATGSWVVTRISATQFDLLASTWAGGFTSAGWATIASNVFPITGAADNGVGLIRLTVPSTAGLYTGDTVNVAGVGGVSNATGAWVVTVIGATTFDLVGSTFAGPFTSGGTAFVTQQYTNSVTANNVDLLYMGTSAAGINADVDISTWGTAAASLTTNNGTYRSRRGQTVSANNILVRLNNTPETNIGADLIRTTTACTHTIANGGQVHATNGFGYALTSTLAATATQSTSKATTVAPASPEPAGTITMNAANLVAATAVSFTFTNAYIGAGDHLNIAHVSGGTAAAYIVTAVCAAGSATITVRNITAGDLAEAIVLRYELIKQTTLGI